MLVHDSYDRAGAGQDETRLEWDGAPSEFQAMGPAFTSRTHLIDQEFRRLRPRTLLDLGCGRGHVTAVAAKYASRVFATDLAVGAVEETRRQLAFHADAHVACVDAFADNWPSDARAPDVFESVLLSEVLEHIEDDLAMLTSLRQLVANSGHLVITVPAHMRLWTQWDVVAGHVRRYERHELVDRLVKAGFVPERVRTWGFPLTGWLAIRGSSLRGRRVRSGSSEAPSLLARAMPRLTPAFRACARVESLFSRTDRGAGYVVVARKR